MGRYVTTDALVLKASRVGDIHKGLKVLSPTLGLVDAIAHGAYKGKSKLGGATDPFIHSRMYLYHNPVHGTYKVTDVEPLRVYHSFRTHLRKFHVGCFWAEIAISTYVGGGEYRVVFEILRGGMAALDGASDEEIDAVSVVVLGRYIDASGYMPDLATCGMCGRALAPTEVVYAGASTFFSCPECRDREAPAVPPGARRYLRYVLDAPQTEAFAVRLDADALSALKRALIRLVQNIVERPLRSIAGAGGLL